MRGESLCAVSLTRFAVRHDMIFVHSRAFPASSLDMSEVGKPTDSVIYGTELRFVVRASARVVDLSEYGGIRAEARTANLCGPPSIDASPSPFYHAARPCRSSGPAR